MIYTVTLNPAIDKVIFIDEYIRASTVRVTLVVESLGGKGTHVSITLKQLGIESTALGVAFGESGRRIIHMLEAEGVNTSFIHLNTPGKESRTNYAIIEQDQPACTMLAERGETLSHEITDPLADQLRSLIRTGDLLVLSGDARNVEDPGVYAKLIDIAHERGAKVSLDASGEYLKEGIKSKPYMIKPNLEELCALVGRDLKTQGEIVDAIDSLAEFSIPIIAMTWGENGSIVKVEDRFYRIGPVSVQTKNATGCGDAFLAGLIAGRERNLPVVETLTLAASLSAATAENEMTCGFNPERAKEIRAQVVVTLLN